MKPDDSFDLAATAREIFAEALRAADAGCALKNAVRLADNRLHVGDATLDLDAYDEILSVAIGKAARPMAAALGEVLGERFAAGVISAPVDDTPLDARWRRFAGGHPLPNEQSLAAAHAAIEVLQRANRASALVIFLISGGGSAMMELPRDPRVTLEELRETNRVLVGCGATIREVNTVRRSLSAIKGGGLSCAARRAGQITLVVSDTNKGEEAAVASGPTFDPLHEDAQSLAAILTRYDLRPLLPASVVRSLDDPTMASVAEVGGVVNGHEEAVRHNRVLLDNECAVEAAAEAARTRGFVVEAAGDLIEQDVEAGCRELVARLFDLRRRAGRGVGLISGGEFACRVRGRGVGGRNAEAALRCAIEINARTETNSSDAPHASGASRVVALHAGTDGIDGNSSAAGAIADDTTLRRAADKGLDAHDYLQRSDAHGFFHKLNDAVVTGATGTNVRDVRIILAR